MNKSENINELALALSKAQASMNNAKKDSKNPFFKSSYADLASVWDAAREPLSSNELAIMQTTIPSDKDEVIVETILAHSSGQWISSVLALPVSKADSQGYGSALTYARRYGLSSMVGVAPAEDDGNAATAAAPKKIVRETITPEVAKMISECHNVDNLELTYQENLATVTSQKEKDSLIAACKAKKERLTNALAPKKNIRETITSMDQLDKCTAIKWTIESKDE